EAQFHGDIGDLAQRCLEVLLDVDRQRLERRHVHHLGGALDGLAALGRAIQRVDADEEAGQRLAGAGGRGDQRVLAGRDVRPALKLRRRRARREAALEPGAYGRMEQTVHRATVAPPGVRMFRHRRYPLTVTDVCLEASGKRVFASAIDWPGWCRSGRTDEGALETLAEYASRYAAVVGAAGIRFPRNAAATLHVVETVPGSATTDFGAPGGIAKLDAKSASVTEAERIAVLVEACWSVFDTVMGAAPAALRKGPRGGG